MPSPITTALTLVIILDAIINPIMLLLPFLPRLQDIEIQAKEVGDSRDIVVPQGKRVQNAGNLHMSSQARIEDHLQSEGHAQLEGYIRRNQDAQRESRFEREEVPQKQRSAQNQTSARIQTLTQNQPSAPNQLHINMNETSATSQSQRRSPDRRIYVLPQRRPRFQTVDGPDAKCW